MTQSEDLLQKLANIADGSPLAEARHLREAAATHTQGSYDVLFSRAEPDDFPLSLRLDLAQKIAHWHGEESLADHYAGLATSGLQEERISAAWVHAERLVFKPAGATPKHLRDLEQSGWSPEAIVTLAQLVAFVSFQSRLLRGYRLLNGENGPASSDRPVTAAAWHTEPQTLGGKKAPPVFTRENLGWEPWLAAKPLAEFNPEEKTALAKFGHTDSDYFRLLARNLPLLEQRTLTDKGIFFSADGLPRKERELAATVASKVNGCIFCASVHARKAAQLSKQTDDIQRLLDTAPGEPLAVDQSPRWLALIEFAASLSATPPTANTQQLTVLREQGLSELELVDLIQSTAFFAWANRLMLTLGEPYIP